MASVSHDKISSQQGLDSTLNSNLALINVARAKPIYDDSGLHRSRHPAAGSMTPYHYDSTRATRKVPAGGELFKVCLFDAAMYFL